MIQYKPGSTCAKMIHLDPWYLRRYMWAAKGIYSSIMSRSATAIPVRIRLIGLRLMSLAVVGK